MPQYTIQLEGGGEMHVNASSQSAAEGNVSGTGNTPVSSGGGGGGGGGGGETTYSTSNGAKTLQQMEDELRAVGWGGGEDVATAYARTTGGAVSGGGGGGGGGGGTAVTARDGQTLYSQSAETQAMFIAVYGDQAAARWATEHNGGAAPTAAPAAATFTTKNGQKTQAQMFAELQAVGYNGPTDDASVRAAYTRTTGGAVSAQPTGNAENPTGQLPPQPKNLIPDAANLNAAADRAIQQAYQAYLNAKLNLDTDDLAFRKAQQAFAEGISEANLLGTYQGQQTLAAKAQEFSQGITAAGVTGMYAGSPTLAAQQQYFQQGLDKEKLQQATANQYLTLISQLRGPEDYGQYLKTMASTPEGLRSLVNAAANTQGRIGVGATGVNPVPVSLQSLTGPIGQGNVGYGNIGGAQYSGLTQEQMTDVANKYTAAKGAAPTSADQLMQWYALEGGGGGSPWTGMAPNTAGGTGYADYMAQANGLPPPSQIAPQNWNAMTDTQRKLLLGMYEQRGWNVTDAMDQYKASLPKYGVGTAQTGSLKLV